MLTKNTRGRIFWAHFFECDSQFICDSPKRIPGDKGVERTFPVRGDIWMNKIINPASPCKIRATCAEAFPAQVNHLPQIRALFIQH